MPRFLVIHHLPPDPEHGGGIGGLTRLAEAANEIGVRAIETFYSEPRSMAFTLYDSPDAESIQRTHERAHAMPPSDILPAEQVFTELLAEPRRARFA